MSGFENNEHNHYAHPFLNKRAQKNEGENSIPEMRNQRILDKIPVTKAP